MRKPKQSPSRERRIIDEIVVDAYGPEERSISRYYYLEDTLDFPFAAKCITTQAVSPLKKGETTEVLGLAPEDACMNAMIVLIRFAGRRLGVPLSQLEVLEGDDQTREAVADWQYWKRMGYKF